MSNNIQVGVYPNATKTADGQLDMTKHDLSVEASLGQVKIVVLFLFINRLLGYLKQFNVSEDAIASARKSAQEGASAAVTAVSVTGIQVGVTPSLLYNDTSMF